MPAHCVEPYLKRRTTTDYGLPPFNFFVQQIPTMDQVTSYSRGRDVVLHRRLLGVAAMAAIFACLAYGGIELTRGAGRLATLWLPNAVLAAVLLRTRTDTFKYHIAACLIANLAVNRLVADSWGTAAVLAAANAVEVVLVFWTMRRLCGRHPQIEVLKTLCWLLLVCLVAPIASGLIAATALATNGQWFSFDNFLSWILTDGLSLMIVTPLVMIAIDAWRVRRPPTLRDLLEWGALLSGTVAAVSLIFAQSRFPFLFLACPIVIVAAFRTGVTGTAVAIAVISLVASAATMLGSGPIMLVHGDVGAKLIALQLFLATSFAMGLPVAAALSGRAAIRRDLQASRDFNQSILDNIQEVIFRTDAKGRWIFLNPAWQTVTGYSAAESLGWTTTKLLHEEDRAVAMAVYPKIVSGEIDEAVLNQRFFRASGECRHIEVLVRRLSDNGGQFIGTTGNIRDISERVRHDAELAESEARFRRMAEAAPVGIFRADAQGQMTYVNPVWCEKVGLTFDQMLGNGWMNALKDTVPFEEDPAWQGFNRPGDSKRRIACFRAADGSDLWIETVNAAEFDQDGKICGFVGAAHDITEQRSAVAKLAESEEQLSLLASNATDAVFRLSLDGHCLYASPSARDLLGIDPALLIGVQLLARFHPDDTQAVLGTFAALARGESEDSVLAYRSELLDQPGTFRWMEAHCGLVRDEEGTPREIIASIRDVSKSKAMEEELRLARERAEAASAAKAAFLANMSHEIRTPMNGVLGFTELLAQSDLDDEQRRQVQLIADSGQAMMELLNDILDMSKIDSGQMRVTAEPVDLGNKLRNCARLMEPIARAKGVDLTITIDPTLPKCIIGDPLRIRQILLNLIGNAVKFTEQGMIAVRAREAGDVLSIDVADSGVGIPADRLEEIFHQFSQADASIARKYGGTGLGLSISAALAKLMGGTIGVASTPGEGATFTLHLPLVEAQEIAKVEDESDLYPAFVTADLLKTAPRVLIAEDHDINQELIAALAKAAGLDPRIAADGAQAIEMVQAAADAGEAFDLVLMDMQMPVIDGLEATRRIRALGYSADRLPIVALTANAYAEDVAACLAAGMQAHLAKPVRLGELQELASRFIQTRREEVALTTTREPPSGTKTVAQRYHERKSATLEAIASSVRNCELDGAMVEELTSMLHKLAGTAGFFGDTPLGEAALRLEHDLAQAEPSDWTDVLAAGWDNLRNAA